MVKLATEMPAEGQELTPVLEPVLLQHQLYMAQVLATVMPVVAQELQITVPEPVLLQRQQFLQIMVKLATEMPVEGQGRLLVPEPVLLQHQPVTQRLQSPPLILLQMDQHKMRILQCQFLIQTMSP
jgi:hypothetical protein